MNVRILIRPTIATLLYLVKGQRKFILVVKSQSKYLAGQHFDRGRRSEYRIYRSVTPLHSNSFAVIGPDRLARIVH